MTRFYFLVILMIINTTWLLGQMDTLYSLGNQPELITKADLTKRIENVANIYKNDTTEWIVRFESQFEEKKGDTLIQNGIIHIIAKSLLSEKDKLELLLNKPIPPFEFTDLNKKIVTEKDFQGKVLLINFWFTRCAPCIAEMPYLDEIKNNYKEQDIAFISMAPEEEKQINVFLKKHPFSYRHIPDADNFLKLFGTGFPKNILIDKKGIIRYIGGGIVDGFIEEGDEGIVEDHQISWEKLRSQIDRLLEE